MPRRCRLSLARWPIAGLLLGSLLASGVVAADEPDPAAALDRAIAAAEDRLQKGDLPAADARYREAVFEGWLLMATLERLEKRLSPAHEALASAAIFAPEDREALQSLATAHLQMGESAAAVEILTALAARDARDVETRRLLAKALAAGGQLEQALQKLDEAAAIDPEDPEMDFLLATEYLWLKRVGQAERLFARVVEARPIPQTRVLIGRAYRDAGEYARARAELQAALRQDPNVRRAHYYLGRVALADPTTGPDRLDQAIAEFHHELKLAPADPLTSDQLGLALLDAGRPAEALPAFLAAVRGEPRSLFVYHLGRCQLALDHAAEAAASTRRALELAREQATAGSELEKIHYQLGLTLRRLGAAEEAASHFAEAKRLSGQGPAELREGGLAAPLAASPERGAAAVGPGGEGSPESELPLQARLELKRRVAAGLARAYFNLGVLQAQNERLEPVARFERAAAFFERSAAVDPDFPQVQSSLGVAYFNARRFDKATGPLVRALAASPGEPGLRRMLAMSWLNTEAWDKAAALLQDDPERSTDASLQFAYGLALLRSGRAAEAERTLAALLTQQADSAELRVLLGQARTELVKQEQEASRKLRGRP